MINTYFVLALTRAIDYLETLPKKPRTRMKWARVRGKRLFRRLMRLKGLYQILFGKVPCVPHDRRAMPAVERKCKRRIVKNWPDHQYLYLDRLSA